MAYETSWYFIFLMRPWPKKLHVSVNLNQTKEKNIQNLIIARLIIFGESGGPHDLCIFNETLEIKGFF
jgi:hypothetical protein